MEKNNEIGGENPLAALLSDPELSAKLSGILGSLTAGEAKNASTDPVTDKLPELVSALSPMLKGKPSGPSHDKRTALLLALRPYLSPARCEAIDYFTKVEKLGRLLINMKL